MSTKCKCWMFQKVWSWASRRRYSSQLQLSHKPKMSVCPSVYISDLRNCSKDLLETLHGVRHWKSKCPSRAGFSKKILDHPKSPKMWSKWQFFDFFSKMALTILMKLGQNVELINSENLAKTACPKKLPFSRYSSTKFRFWPKMPKVVSKECPISRER